MAENARREARAALVVWLGMQPGSGTPPEEERWMTLSSYPHVTSSTNLVQPAPCRVLLWESTCRSQHALEELGFEYVGRPPHAFYLR
jgi:hypothetical protein